jgi:Acetyltransferase (GNAT) domain
MFGQTVFYAFNGRAKADLALRPNDALHWRALHDACAEGYRRYDFGEVPVGNEGLARFKNKWATDAAPLYRYYYPPPEKEARVDAVAGSRGGSSRRRAGGGSRSGRPLTSATGSTATCDAAESAGIASSFVTRILYGRPPAYDLC